MSSNAAVHLYSIQVCPFAQRTRILLTLKGVPFELTEIDITRPRPAWFLELNPLGKVPVIAHAGRVLNESSVINEYLEEVFPARRVFPEDAYRRAQSRIFIDYVNHGFVAPMYQLLMNQDPAKEDALIASARATWA
ncbi:glutathione S-transferase family protein [Sandaracinus amylolyticus]|uniref:glutathione S-transferase family protein n=1 Tax=Sandaracinus amylolyticus TaxID=927083 RepID=UPI001F37ACCF|nr:glutathione S-transferase N-terminal domain-containing protein [Sandaracinus amylolyticus]UJR81360.1 GST N-terminal domain-containing protein [Sandaracinus amylolyticus]